MYSGTALVRLFHHHHRNNESQKKTGNFRDRNSLFKSRRRYVIWGAYDGQLHVLGPRGNTAHHRIRIRWKERRWIRPPRNTAPPLPGGGGLAALPRNDNTQEPGRGSPTAWEWEGNPNADRVVARHVHCLGERPLSSRKVGLPRGSWNRLSMIGHDGGANSTPRQLGDWGLHNRHRHDCAL